MDLFLEKIAPPLIAGILTLIGCLLNNYYQLKRDRENRDEEHKNDLDLLQDTYLNKIGEIKADYTSQVHDLNKAIEEIKHSVEKLTDKMSHQLQLTNMEIQTLSKKQDAYNNLQTRTYNLEKDVALHEECIKVANHRIDDLERLQK